MQLLAVGVQISIDIGANTLYTFNLSINSLQYTSIHTNLCFSKPIDMLFEGLESVEDLLNILKQSTCIFKISTEPFLTLCRLCLSSALEVLLVLLYIIT